MGDWFEVILSQNSAKVRFLQLLDIFRGLNIRNFSYLEHFFYRKYVSKI